MKKVLGIIAGIAFGTVGFGQAGVTFTDASATYDPSQTTEFHFAYTSAYSAASIAEAAAHYTEYLTVSTTPSATGTNTTVSLVSDTEMNRMVVGRFLVTSVGGTWDINVSGSDMNIRDFVDEYIVE